MPMGKSDETLLDSPNTGSHLFDKFQLINRQLDHIVKRVEILGEFFVPFGPTNGKDLIDEAIYPFVKDLKKIANQAMNRLQEVAEENQQKIFGAKDYERR